jgi:glycosyltransferase involved in cell wall biosynthesis
VSFADRSIVYASTNHAWAYGWTFYQMLAETLARENDVVYVDPPLSLARVRRRSAAVLRGPSAEAVGPRLRLFRTATIPRQKTPRARALAAWLLGVQTSVWARRRGFRPDLVWTYAPSELALAKRFPSAQVVYWTGDEVVLPGENALLERADAILCVSDPVFDRHRAAHGGKVHFVPVACDFERYRAELDRPLLDLGVERPVLGYAGWVNERVEVGLLVDLARRLDHGTVVVAGPDKLAADERAALEAEPRIVLLGPQPADRVPALVRSFDVCLIPYRDSAFNRGSNPVKFYEYLALGKPVVATDVPTLRRFADAASIGDSATFVERALAAVADDEPPEPRVEVARRHSFGALLERLGEVLG